MYVVLMRLSKMMCKITKKFQKTVAFMDKVMYYKDAKTIK